MPGPVLRVGDARRPERREIAPHQRRQSARFRSGSRAPASPRRARSRRRRETPGRIVGHLHQRQVGAHGVAHGAFVGDREARREMGAGGVEGRRPGGEERPCRGEELLHVEALGPVAQDALHAAREHRLQRAAEGEEVVGGEQVKRAAPGRRAHHAALVERRRERRALEAGETRPQPEIGRPWNLRLHPGEPGDRAPRPAPSRARAASAARASPG